MGALLSTEEFVPTTEELLRAHECFEEKEPRWREYWRAVEGVKEALDVGDVTLAAISLKRFLESWNWGYYRFKPKKRAALQGILQQLITNHLGAVTAFRARSLPTMTVSDCKPVMDLFMALVQELGPVGTAKVLNVLAPDFHPLWDNPIAGWYCVQVGPRGYLLFMSLVKHQIGLLHFLTV